jgi:hypothetical protein
VSSLRQWFAIAINTDFIDPRAVECSRTQFMAVILTGTPFRRRETI